MNRSLARAHYVLAGLILAAVAVQFFLAGLGLFEGRTSDIDQHGTKIVEVSTLDPHRVLGDVIVLAALVLLILAALARVGRRMVIRSAALFVLTILQALFAGLGADTAAIFGALHGLNALLIAGLTAHIFIAARAYGGSPGAAAARGAPDALP